MPDQFAHLAGIARDVGVALAGLVGAMFAGWSAFAANRQALTSANQFNLARHDHVAEIFSRAICQLSDERLEVRLGAAYTFIALCEDGGYADFTKPVVETLFAYVRERSVQHKSGKMPPEISAIQAFVFSRVRS